MDLKIEIIKYIFSYYKMRLSIETIFVGLTIFLLIYLSQRDDSDNTNNETNTDERVVIMPGYINPYYRNPYYRRYPHYYPHISPHRHGPGPRPRPRHHRRGPHRGRPHRERNGNSNTETPVTETQDL